VQVVVQLRERRQRVLEFDLGARLDLPYLALSHALRPRLLELLDCAESRPGHAGGHVEPAVLVRLVVGQVRPRDDGPFPQQVRHAQLQPLGVLPEQVFHPPPNLRFSQEFVGGLAGTLIGGRQADRQGRTGAVAVLAVLLAEAQVLRAEFRERGHILTVTESGGTGHGEVRGR
jgi:hypothetical protein